MPLAISFAMLPPGPGARPDRAQERAAVRRLALAHLTAQAGAGAGISLTRTSRGAPRAQVGGRRLPISFSHSGAFLAVATCGPGARAIGIDLEPADRLARRAAQALPLARRWLGEAAAEALARLPASARPGAFLRLWTTREALVKAQEHGRGLTPLPLSAAALAGLLAERDRPPAAAGEWHLAELAPPAFVCAWTEARGCVVALAARAPARVQCGWLG